MKGLESFDSGDIPELFVFYSIQGFVTRIEDVNQQRPDVEYDFFLAHSQKCLHGPAHS